MLLSNNLLSLGYLSDTVSQAQKQLEVEKEELIDYGMLNISTIKSVDFPKEQYYRKVTNKNQIVIHHTVSGRGVQGDIRWWEMTKSRVATHVIIDRSGTIFQLFSSKYWGHHLGVKSDFLYKQGFVDYKTRNVLLNKAAIGIEIDSWGGLVEDNGKYYPALWDSKLKKNVANKKANPIPEKDVIKYDEPFRGFTYFEKYTPEQIKSLAQLLKYWGNGYNIPTTYNEDMWNVSKEALNGKSGIWSHTSYRNDKSDTHPQPSLIKMLKNI
jgi:N-acetyl-anhydromuramyl-L-alanine amidase AmpD